MSAKITIVTAVLNQAEALEETIRSVVALAWPNLDYVIIDGGSIDGTVDTILRYENSLTTWVSEADTGVYAAMNKGWALADPDSYVLFLGAGDKLISLPPKLPDPKRQTGILIGQVMLGGKKKFLMSTDWRLKLYNSLHHQGLLVPKQLHPAPPFNLAYRLYADFDFNQKLKKTGVKFQYVPGFSCYAAPGGLTTKTDINEMTAVVEENYGLCWWFLSRIGYRLAYCFPGLKKFKPIIAG